jgi:hypothetical protein
MHLHVAGAVRSAAFRRKCFSSEHLLDRVEIGTVGRQEE